MPDSNLSIVIARNSCNGNQSNSKLAFQGNVRKKLVMGYILVILRVWYLNEVEVFQINSGRPIPLRIILLPTELLSHTMKVKKKISLHYFVFFICTVWYQL